MIYLLVNNEYFQEHEYGDESIKKEAQLVRYKIDIKTPSFKYIFLKSSELNDNSDFLSISGE